MSESAATTYEEAIELAWVRMKPVACYPDSGPRRCNKCESYKEYGLTACQGCCGR